MKYLCLRDCYVNDRFWRQGETYELPDDMNKSEKNFKSLEAGPELVPELSPDALESSTGARPEKIKPDVLPNGMFWCTKCKALHRENKKTGQKHLKYREIVEV